jgi:hypothetical protein
MKTAIPPSSTKTSPKPQPSSPTAEEREAFFRECYLRLLSGALNQFEVYDPDGNARTLYQHEKLEAKARAHEYDAEADRLWAKVSDADEELRMAVLVDRCYCMAVKATNRYFEERGLSANFASECA